MPIHSLARELDGDVKIEFRSSGVRFRANISLERDALLKPKNPLTDEVAEHCRPRNRS